MDHADKPSEVGISVMLANGIISAKVHSEGKNSLIAETDDESHAGYLYCLDEINKWAEKNGYEGRIIGGSGYLKKKKE